MVVLVLMRGLAAAGATAAAGGDADAAANLRYVQRLGAMAECAADPACSCVANAG